MIVIRTCKTNKATGQPRYKEYYCTTGVKAGMSELNEDRRHNDLTVYSPTEIVDVWDNNDERERDCEHCAEVDLIVGFNLCEDGNLDIRFDPENAEIDVIYLHKDIDRSIQINYCPFCGKRLREREER